MPLSAKHTYTPDTPLGFINDDLAQLYGELNTPTHEHSAGQITSGTFADARISESSVTQHESALAVNVSQLTDYALFLSPHSYAYDSARLSWATGLGGSRLAALKIPDNPSTSGYSWAGVPLPAAWLVGTNHVTTTLALGISVNGTTGDAIYINSIGFGYDSGDDLTSPTIQWNEAATVDVSSWLAGYAYRVQLVETSATVSANDFVSIRLGWLTTNAAWTYTGDLYFFGSQFGV